MTRPRHSHSLLLALLATGCSLSVDYSKSHFSCSDDLCPDGFDCQAGFCEPVEGPDAGEPVFIDAEVPDAVPGAPDAVPACSGADQIFDPGSSHCYSFHRSGLIWVDAAGACAALGPTAHLAIITSSAENVVVSLLGDNGSSQLTWLGGTDGQTEGDWRWLDSFDFPPSPLPNVYSFARWNSGEPNNGASSGTPENCVAIQLGSTNHGGWDDRVCGIARPYICETE